MASPTIEELLKSLQSPDYKKNNKSLHNTAETWKRIGEKDSFDELGLSKTELEGFLNDWVKENPYNNI